MTEFKDARLKYLELPREFHGRASEVNVGCKQHIRTCEQLAKRLAKERPNTAQEFEKNEWLKDFVIKSSQLNENTLALLDYIQSVLDKIANDYETVGVALQRDTLRFQSETIQILTQQRDDLVKDLYDEKKRKFRGMDQGAA